MRHSVVGYSYSTHSQRRLNWERGQRPYFYIAYFHSYIFISNHKKYIAYFYSHIFISYNKNIHITLYLPSLSESLISCRRFEGRDFFGVERGDFFGVERGDFFGVE